MILCYKIIFLIIIILLLIDLENGRNIWLTDFGNNFKLIKLIKQYVN
jgi:hypothetical protein